MQCLRNLSFHFYFFIFLIPCSVFSQEVKNDSLAAESVLPQDFTTEVTVSGRVSQTEVPLNRSLTFTVTVSWTGDLSGIEIEELENPELTNFEIVETAASNMVERKGGISYNKKVFTYTLKPLEMGMGYIDAVFLRYRDIGTDETHRLATQRIGVKTVDPIREEDGLSIYLLIGIMVVLAGGVGIGIVLFIRRRQEKAQALMLEQEEKVDLEGEFLTQLKEIRRDEFRDPVKVITELSHIIREYLSQKYEFEMGGKSALQISNLLREKGLEEDMVNKIQDCLSSLDEYKFSGKQAETSVLQVLYASVEAVIEHHLLSLEKTQRAKLK